MSIALRDYIQGVASDRLARALDDGPGWQIEVGGKPVLWSVGSGPTQTENSGVGWVLLDDSGLQAKVALVRGRQARTATLQVILTNRADHPSVPLSAIKPLELRFQSVVREGVQVRTVGGGLSNAYYPPGAYRETNVSLRTGYGQPLRIESGLDGRSSNRDLPFLQVTLDGEPSGGIVAALEWSGRWYQQVRPDRVDHSLVWETGVPIKELILAPHEALRLPTVHLIGFEGDQDAGGNACRQYVYDGISPNLDGHRPIPPLSYDHWFGVGCDLNEQLLRSLVDRAADVGLEYFVLDAGWFPGCGPGQLFSTGVGNWERVDLEKFPDGLEPLAEHVHGRGLKFGLWFEPERAHRDSDLARLHPDWCIDIGQEYLHVNLALREAQDYIIRVLSGWIDRLGLEWSRWDYNIGPLPYWEHIDPTGKVQFAYMEGLYRVLDTLMRAHPRWLVECCASGGRRIDLGTLRRAHTIWFSDHTDDALVCRFMQNGANRFLPGHLPNSAVPVQRNAGDGTITDADVISRMCGALSLDGDIASWSAGLTRRVAELISLYKEFRHLLVEDFYPLSPQPTRPEDGEVVQFVRRDGADAVVLVFRGVNGHGTFTVAPRGLDPSAAYRVWKPLTGWETSRSGTALRTEGIECSLATGAEILRLRRI